MHHADPRARGRRIMRSHVEISFGGRWKEGKAAAPSCNDGHILDRIVMGRDLRRIADPQARLRGGRNQWQWVRPGESREVAFCNHALRRYREGPVAFLLLSKSGDYPGNIALSAREIHRVLSSA